MSQEKAGIRLVQRPEQPTAVVRDKVPMNELPDFFGRAYGAVMEAAQNQGVQLTGPPFGRYLGMPTDTVDVEAGFPVSAPITASAGVEAGTLPACRAFEATHVGPYDSLVTTYNDIQERMKEEGFSPSDSMWEYYLSDPATEPDPATWRTLVVWPVA